MTHHPVRHRVKTVGGEGSHEAISGGIRDRSKAEASGKNRMYSKSGTVSRVGLRTKTWPFRDRTRAISATAWPGRRW